MGYEPESRPVTKSGLRCLLGDVGAVFEFKEPSLNDIGGVERNNTKSDVGVSLGKVKQARTSQYLDLDIGVDCREIRQDRREDVGPKPVRRRNAQTAFEILLLPRKPALQGESAFFHLLGQRDDPVALFGQNKAVRRALEKRVTDRLLKCAKAPAHGRMAGLKRPRRAAKCPRSRRSKKNPDVTPLHLDGPHKTERGEYNYVSLRTNLIT